VLRLRVVDIASISFVFQYSKFVRWIRSFN
jgi:hypothetical protein